MARQQREEWWRLLREWWAAAGLEDGSWAAYEAAVAITWSRIGPPLPPESVLPHDGLSLSEAERRKPLAAAWMAAHGIPSYQWGAVRQRAMTVHDLVDVDARRYLGESVDLDDLVDPDERHRGRP